MKDLYEEILQQARARVGRTLCGKYSVDRVIGIGGMATVYAGIHLRNANRVALKVLHPHVAMSADLRARFLREGYAANSVDHPGTVRVLDDDKAEDGSIFLVMELLDGETLDARLTRSQNRLGIGEVVSLISDVLDVLGAAHAKGVIHRDIKPENLFLTRDGQVKVLDFGIARLRSGSNARTTGAGSLGSPAFMPPEQALGHVDEVDARSDVWSVGATAFTLLTGKYVHEASTAAEMIVRRGSSPAPKVLTVAPEVPPAIARVIDQALSFERHERWSTARAMKDALEQARSEAFPPAAEDEREERTNVSLDTAPHAPVVQLEPQDIVSIRPVKEGASTVGGLATNGAVRSGRSRRKRLALAAGAAATGGALILLALSSWPGRRTSGPGVASASAAVARVGAAGAVAPGAAVSLPAAAARPHPAPATDTPSPPSEPPSQPVDALPKAAGAAPSERAASLPAPRVRTDSPAPTHTGAASPPRPPQKHDPLSPW
jgi:serine/threonine protein kinase